MDSNKPLFTISEKAMSLLYQIAQDLERINIVAESVLTPTLRKTNRIKSIHSSLYIENNTLSAEQVADIVNGKKVVGPQREIDEVKAAIIAYKHILECNPYSVEDLLKEHKYMMGGLIENAGRFRNKGVAVFRDTMPIHIAPPADRVPTLISNLLKWVEESDYPQLIKTCVFHYEFEFIHPFSDGNGRMGRLWQTLLLYQENAVFGWLPIETIIVANQDEYYETIRQSTANSDCGIFIDFMLSVIAKAVHNFRITNAISSDETANSLTDIEKQVLSMIKNNPSITYDELANATNKDRRTISRAIEALKSQAIIERSGSKKSGIWIVNDIDSLTKNAA